MLVATLALDFRIHGNAACRPHPHRLRLVRCGLVVCVQGCIRYSSLPTIDRYRMQRCKIERLVVIYDIHDTVALNRVDYTLSLNIYTGHVIYTVT